MSPPTVTDSPDKVISVTFLLTVNDTWYPGEYHKKCIQTVKTPPLKPNQKWNESVNILVGECDHGPLTYMVSDEGTRCGGHTCVHAHLCLYACVQ